MRTLETQEIYRLLLSACRLCTSVTDVHNFLQSAFMKTKLHRFSIMEFVTLRLCGENPVKVLVLNYRHTILVVVDYRRKSRFGYKRVPYFRLENAMTYDDFRFFMHEVRPILRRVADVQNTSFLKFIGFGDGAALSTLLALDSVTYCEDTVKPRVCLCMFNSTSAGDTTLYEYVRRDVDRDMSFHVNFVRSRCLAPTKKIVNESVQVYRGCWWRKFDLTDLLDI
jgi:hypothetical protein